MFPLFHAIVKLAFNCIEYRYSSASQRKPQSINKNNLMKHTHICNQDPLYGSTFPLALGSDIGALGMKCLANALLTLAHNKLY